LSRIFKLDRIYIYMSRIFATHTPLQLPSVLMYANRVIDQLGHRI